ncbi:MULTISPECIES: NAD(P)H-hydrate dehydratase [unclassified Mucilaginibacter]|uniref:NAD(P)H-hydrate dehydratase n=1 Tax=unclassified Mucilaginibacter TaxID=2617802 RepID=UPI00096147D2|nr:MULTISPECIES: NAD(P)H-hydrate dehydratase [unclassified Mucilaginibacter]OJW16438.1 MAG: bifunctional ADP-dependent (S)-NAD(P)H-hydrate dehydratase/NAD(P)H-hydrate epimerase [Mucilaginibacter sp. 44-25]PLW89692.1 MAG: bifunctional ADP-dependent NAD(P)H-hydrate dehydratase/NAD(P)H-hydrate epimerase [Mucilaginibacter sp.]PMP65370.1 MAG: bifunctional ADP-dependent NAD(P)H-hydrate dehydratase/NAD(P)H-hydrate epimerase [Mucilaginibacter sp.]HEK19468.1 NAD(P)H-hydrate dehydratase [Bacteroidota bac
MLPLLTSNQIREADAYTIAHEPVNSIDLMERASKAFVGWFINHFQDKQQSIAVYCGTGNNGGDGLAIARLLVDHGYTQLSVIITRFTDKASSDFNTNLFRIKETSIPLTELTQVEDHYAETASLVIDAMLGSGINKPLTGHYQTLVKCLNRLNKTTVAVDVPTGFYTDGEIEADALVLRADLVITFQQPKINFLLPESGLHINCFEVVDIGLSRNFIDEVNTPYYYVQEHDIKAVAKPRKRFSNKGTYGHALVIAGKDETMGAALLASSACAHAGAGLTTACIPQSGLIALNSAMPEVMALIRKTGEPPHIEWDKYSVIAVGPGLGTEDGTLQLLKAVFENYTKPVVIDADALNILGKHQELLNKIPAGSILTPHMKEFDRLFGQHQNWWQRIQTAKKKAQELGLNIILKNDYTITVTPKGKLYFNATGNPAMATGGMGDVLTGVITGLLAQKYTPEDACLLGVYLHGRAGDELALPNRMHVVLPQYVIEQLPATLAKLTA